MSYMFRIQVKFLDFSWWPNSPGAPRDLSLLQRHMCMNFIIQCNADMKMILIRPFQGVFGVPRALHVVKCFAFVCSSSWKLLAMLVLR